MLVLFAVVVAPVVGAAGRSESEVAEHSMRQFLSQQDVLHAYRGTRRLEAENGDRVGWLEATTTYSTAAGFAYRVTGEGGTASIREKVLKAVLEAEREAIERGEMAKAALAPINYQFQPAGVEHGGLASVTLSPRRKDRALVAGRMLLHPDDGALVELRGRLAKSPSFWIKSVDIVRKYERIDGAVVPVALESTAELRMLGRATLKMTYVYSEIDGRPVQARATPLLANRVN